MVLNVRRGIVHQSGGIALGRGGQPGRWCRPARSRSYACSRRCGIAQAASHARLTLLHLLVVAVHVGVEDPRQHAVRGLDHERVRAGIDLQDMIVG